MNRDLLFHVVAFVNSRDVRDVLGYGWERCMQLRLPPCRARLEPRVVNALKNIYIARINHKPIVVYKPDVGVVVSVKFWWRFQRLTLKVRTYVTLVENQRIVSGEKSVQRTYYTYYLHTGNDIEHSEFVHDPHTDEWLHFLHDC